MLWLLCWLSLNRQLKVFDCTNFELLRSRTDHRRDNYRIRFLYFFFNSDLLRGCNTSLSIWCSIRLKFLCHCVSIKSGYLWCFCSGDDRVQMSLRFLHIHLGLCIVNRGLLRSELLAFLLQKVNPRRLWSFVSYSNCWASLICLTWQILVVIVFPLGFVLGNS